MTTGKLPFEGPTLTAALAKISESEPVPVSEIRSPLPFELERIIQRCLRKDPKERFNDTRDLAIDLKELQKSIASGSAVSVGGAVKWHDPLEVKRGRRRRLMVAFGVAFGLLAVTIGIIRFGSFKAKPTASAVRRQVTFTGRSSFPAISPDGQFLAYVDASATPMKLMVQDLSGGLPVQIFEGSYLPEARWSPDGSKLLTGALPGGPGGVVPRLGGEIQQLPILNYSSWSPDGTRYATVDPASTRILFVDIATGTVTRVPVSAKGLVFWRGLDWSPDGDLLVLASIDEDQRGAIWTIRSDGNQQQKIYESSKGLSSPKWSFDGNGVYFLVGSEWVGAASSELWKIAVSPSSGIAMGEPSLIMSGLRAGESFSMARDGKRIAIADVITQSNLWLVERSATSELQTRQLTQGTALNRTPSVSPDGNKIAFASGDDKVSNIFTMSIEGGAPPKQITFLNSVSSGPVWSPGGNRIAFAPDWRARTCACPHPSRRWSRARFR